jgi:hypothetical protein
MVPRVSMRTGTINLNPLNYDVDGMNLRMIVADLDMDVMISSVLTSSFGTQKENLEVAFYLKNHGAVEYRDVTVQLETGTHMTPFVNPVLPGEGLSESFTMPGTLSPGDQVRVSIYVDLSETATPGTYDVPVLVTGDETRTGQPLSGELTLRVLVTGDGPKLNIRAVSPSTIACVGDFTLTLTLDNVGDDTARGIVLGTRQAAEGMTPPEGTMRPFEPLALPIYLDDMVPGNTSMVEIPMRCNPGLEDETAYPILFTLDYVDSRGNHPSSVQAVQEVSIKLERGDGPALEFRTVSPETFKAGEDFTLSLALFNTGDEVAHNVVLGMGPQDVKSEGSEPPSRETPPQPTTLPLYLGDIEPDKFVMVEIDMRCNKDMMEGHVYAICFCIDYTNDAGEHPSDTEAQHQVSVRTKGTPVTAESTMYSTGNMLMYVLMVCMIVVVAIYAIGTITRVQQGRRPKVKEGTEVTPRPPTPAETQQYYADYGTTYQEPQDEQYSAQEQDAGSEEQASYDQPQEEAYTQDQTTTEADTSSYYENQLWGGGGEDGSEGSDTQEPPPP